MGYLEILVCKLFFYSTILWIINAMQRRLRELGALHYVRILYIGWAVCLFGIFRGIFCRDTAYAMLRPENDNPEQPIIFIVATVFLLLSTQICCRLRGYDAMADRLSLAWDCYIIIPITLIGYSPVGAIALVLVFTLPLLLLFPLNRRRKALIAQGNVYRAYLNYLVLLPIYYLNK
jgi:hypothetical protein